MTECWEKPCEYLHMPTILVPLPAQQGLLNLDQAAGNSYNWSIYGSSAKAEN